jgi:hypothetical protein
MKGTWQPVRKPAFGDQPSHVTFLASEALGYRFFYSLRIHAGPDATAWLPQGQLLNTIQNGISYFLIDRNPAKLRTILNIFAITTVAVIDLLAVALLIAAARLRSISLGDIFLLGVTLIAPIYLATDMATAALWSDYTLLNIVMAAGAVLLFQWTWRTRGEGSSLVKVLLAGVYVGLLASNKISMASVGVPAVAVAISIAPVKWWTFILRGSLAVVVSVLVFGFVFLASGLFQIDWLLAVAQPWYQFVTNPDGDGSRLIDSILTPSAALMIWGTLASLVAIITGPQTIRRWWVLFTIVVMSGAACVFILARPAATTVADTAVQLLALGAMALTTIDRIAVRRTTGAVLATACLVLVALFPFQNFGWWLSNSGPIADGQWQFFDKTMAAANGRKVVYYVPNNSYQRGDPFIILLKGSSDFATWNVPASGQRILDRYAPGLSFVSDRTGGARNVAKNSLAVWIDLAGFPKIENHYSVLGAAIKCCSTPILEHSVPRAAAVGYIAAIN